MKHGIRILMFAIGLTLAAIAAPGAMAQDTVRGELTAFWGYRIGGDFDGVDDPSINDLEVDDAGAYGLALTVPVGEEAAFVSFYSRQESALTAGTFLGFDEDLFDLDVENLHIGGSYRPGSDQDTIRGYWEFTLGLTRFDPAGGRDSETRFSFGIGAGVQLRLNPWLGLRLQGRWVPTVIDSDDEVFCDPNNVCFIVFDTEYFTQTEISAGLTFAF